RRRAVRADDQVDDSMDGSFDVFVERHQSPRSACPIHIDYDATERMLGTLTHERLVRLTGIPVLGSSDLGRALGRILAHDHQPRGLMRACYRPMISSIFGERFSRFPNSRWNDSTSASGSSILRWMHPQNFSPAPTSRETHRYALRLHAGEYVKVLVEQRGID